ncbi:hypothetical protein BN1723_020267, partial [Verticillium longisporum]
RARPRAPPDRRQVEPRQARRHGEARRVPREARQEGRRRRRLPGPHQPQPRPHRVLRQAGGDAGSRLDRGEEADLRRLCRQAPALRRAPPPAAQFSDRRRLQDGRQGVPDVGTQQG